MCERKELLSIQDLSVHYITKDMGTCKAVNNVSFNICEGETIGLVGETGAGKTTIALSILGLIPSPPGKIVDGKIVYKGEDLLKKNNKAMQKIRGKEISMIFQDPMTTLNPIDTVGDQIAEVIGLHNHVSKKEAIEQAGKMLEMVGIPKERYGEYPHQFSGGMKQRVVIAMALACSPALLLADEPTTALDVTIQAQILEMMNDIKKTHDGAIMLITHDLGVVAQMCDRVAIVYAGEILEIGTVQQVYKNILHPYTKGLFESLPGYSAGKRLKQIDGLMPDPSDLPPLCKFEPRCPYSCEQCKKEMPQLIDVGDGHMVRCLRVQKGQV
ncbi:ABC transporter ATP-binding protein [Laedolimicola sp.]|uniref:ABC transporter ATP-binding protein n=1 Tax=Laedolimicola sp. TaxID=2981663 RepID=UPI003F813ADD